GPAARPPALRPPKPPHTEAAAPPPLLLDAGNAHIAGWLAIAGVNAIVIAIMLPLPGGGLRVRAMHHLYDAAQLLAAGLVTAAVVRAWERFGPRSRWLAYAAVGLVSVVVGALALPDDLDNFATRVGGR